jgi:ERCC4-type nuclease
MTEEETPSGITGSRIFFVDHRERQEVIENLNFFTSMPPFDAYQFLVRQLPVGDVVYKSFGLEEKSVWDFRNSIYDGRFKRQVYEMSQNFSKAAIAVSGDVSSLNETSQKAVSTSEWKAWLKFGIPTFHYTDDFFMCYGILKGIELLDSNLGPGRPSVRSKEKTADKLVAIVSRFDYVSKKRGRRLLEHFHTLSILFNATKEQLTEVYGIGDKIAGQFVTLLHKRYFAPKKKKAENE